MSVEGGGGKFGNKKRHQSQGRVFNGGDKTSADSGSFPFSPLSYTSADLKMRLDGWGKGEGCCLPNLECLYNIEASLIGPDMTVSVYDSTWN